MVLRIYCAFVAVFCLSKTARTSIQSTIYRDHQIYYGNFKQNQNQSLLAMMIASHHVKDELDCAFRCIQEPRCFSYNTATSPGPDDIYMCEVLATDKYRAQDKLQENSSFHHFSPMSPCESNPCQNNGECIPDLKQNSYFCNCTPEFLGTHCTAKSCKFDFEDGLGGWTRNGSAFDNQPTYGDNPTARHRESANQQGDRWIGTFENRSFIETLAGSVQGDGPQGTLTSPSFNIMGKYISFLIGGSCDINLSRAELIIGGQVVRSAFGKCIETMTRETWEVEQFIGQSANVKLVDASSSSWSHINFDDLIGDISCEPVKPCKFDFEDGLGSWIRSGTAFDNQPTYGDNSAARGMGSAQKQGDRWIGTFEHRPSVETAAGGEQGDGPQGTLTSPSFNVTEKFISFLIGGGCDINSIRAELVVSGQVIRSTTGKCVETMARETWEVGQFIGQSAQVKLVDASSSAWGHINFDDLRGDISCEQG